MSEDDRGPNPHLAEALKIARRFDTLKQREMARFVFDNLCYFDFWQARGSAELLQLSMLALDGRSISRRRHVEPEAVYLVRIWASEKLGAARGEVTEKRHRGNEALLRRFVSRSLPRYEIDEILGHDWAV